MGSPSLFASGYVCGSPAACGSAASGVDSVGSSGLPECALSESVERASGEASAE